MAVEPPIAKRVLLVDDEQLVCAAVSMLLKIDGYEVETAGDAAQALARIDTAPYDLFLVDYEMPGMKGDELAANIRQRFPHTPVIMLTAHGEMLRASSRSLPGIDLIVDKPFRLETLREGIARAVAMHPAA